MISKSELNGYWKNETGKNVRHIQGTGANHGHSFILSQVFI